MDKGSLAQLIPHSCHVENYGGNWEVVLSMVLSGSQHSAKISWEKRARKLSTSEGWWQRLVTKSGVPIPHYKYPASPALRKTLFHQDISVPALFVFS